jgi:hypothetical protein
LSDTTETQGVLPLSRGGTGNSLSPVAGAIVYSSNDKLYLTTAGSIGQVLRSGGPGGVPFWTEVGAGTVISVAVATANGFAGTVASPTLSPIITLSTTVSGLLKGNGTELSAATAGIDYVAPGAYTASGLTLASARLLGRTTASVGAAEEISVGNGLTLASGSLVNAAPDQVVALTGGTAISVTGSYPSFSVTNTAPDQVVSLTGAGTTTVTGTYPSFTITSNDSTAGTVTSVNASGGTTGMSFTGGPITSAGTLTLNGTLAVANGGTGATDAVAALTNLGAYPASNPSGFTSNVGTVTSVSGTGTVSGLSLSGTVTSAGSLTLGGTLAVLPSNFASQTANTVLAAPNGSAGVPTFRAIVAADIPTLNQNTTGTASNVTGIVAVANGGTGASVAATARTNLSAAASGANTDITSIALTTGTISTSPVNGTDIVNKAYADSIASGINFHQSVRLATAAALPANTYNNGTSGVGATLTANANGALSVDGVAVVAGNRILVKDEVAGANNGVYVVTQVGSGSTPYILTRATDFDSAGTGVDQIDAGDFFLVTAGSTLSNTSWVQQTPLPITVGTTAIVFSQFAAPVLYSAGTGLSLAGTVFSITNTGVAASTYGSASSVPVIAVNAQGQLTSASSSSIAIAASQITSGALAIANGGTGATSAATALTNLGAYPASNPSGFTSNTGTVTSVNLTAGTGVSVSGGPITASGSITVTNTAPDQVVSLTGSGATTVTGTYPNFTISSPTSGAGTVTSINVSGGTTGLTTSGGPVTTSGTITLAGTLNVANGGTGATTLSSGYLLKGNGTSAVSASVVYDTGTNVGIGTASPGAKLDVAGNIITRTSNDILDMGVFANEGYIQTYNNASGIAAIPMRFLTGTAERMRINASGNLLVGTTTDFGGRLTLIPATTPTTFVGGNQLQIGEATNNTAYRLQVGYINHPVQGYVGSIQSYAGGVPSSLVLQGAGGNVGINTAAPGAKLETFNDVGGVNALRLNTNFAGGNYVDLNPFISGVSNGGFSISLNGTIRQVIDTSGNAGFGTTSPTARLEINGGPAMTAGWTRSAMLTAAFPVLVFNSASTKYAGIGVDYTTASAAMRFWVNASSSDVVTGTNAMNINTGGYVEAGGSFRAPIFYDLDNTAYYLDAANYSVLSNIQYGINYTSGGGGGRTIIGPGSPYSIRQEFGSDNTGWRYGIAKNVSGTITIQFYVSDSGTAEAVGDFRAPIFYDSANTGYYIDAASTSNLNALTTQGALNAGNGTLTAAGTTFSNVLAGRGTFRVVAFDGNGNGAPSVWWTNGGTAIGAIDAISGGGLAHWANNGSSWQQQMAVNYGNVTINTDIRSPIYYDSNNTAYYVDPASLSNLVTIYATKAAANNTPAIQVRGGSPGFPRIQTYGLDADANAWMGLGTDMGGGPYEHSVYFPNGSGSGRLSIGDYNGTTYNPRLWVYPTYTQINNSARSPIFYDSDNTGYFLDPASTGNALRTVGYWIADTTGWAGDIDGKIQRHNNSWYFSASNAWIFRATSGAEPFTVNQGGTAIAAADMRAPIFYDNNNTGFYGDFASTSVMADAVIGGRTMSTAMFYAGFTLDANTMPSNSTGFTYGVNAPFVGPIIRAGQPAGGGYDLWFNAPYGGGGRLAFRTRNGDTATLNAWQYPALYDQNVNGGGALYATIYYDQGNTAYYLDPAAGSRLGGQVLFDGGTVIQGNGDVYSRRSSGTTGVYYFADGGSKYLFWDGGAYFFGPAGFTQSDVSMRAPIYYDSNDTGYYIDLNSTSDVAMRMRGGMLLGPNTTWGAYLRVGTNGWVGDHSSIAVTNGNLHIDAQPGFQLYLAWYNTSDIMVGGGIQARIYYDRDNTGFYLDPASTSYLNTVSMGAQTWRADITWNNAVNIIVPASAECSFDVGSGGVWQVWDTPAGSPMIRAAAGTNVEIGQAGSRGLYVYGSITASGNVTAYSDIRIKANIETIPSALDKLDLIRGVTYTRTDLEDKERRYAGVIAQEIEAVLPEAVGGDEDIKTVDYNATIALLIEAVKELTDKVKALEAKEQ